MKKVLGLLLLAVLAAVMILTAGCGAKEDVTEEPIIDLEDAQEEADALAGDDLELAELDDSTIYIEPLSPDFDDIHFEYDKYDILRGDEAILQRVSAWLEENADTEVMIEGHCDERGTNEYNMALGEQRALAARRYLVGLGIDSDRLHTISYGEEQPIDIGSNETAWAKNRRAHFVVSQ